jgi:hypothetical protein
LERIEKPQISLGRLPLSHLDAAAALGLVPAHEPVGLLKARQADDLAEFEATQAGRHDVLWRKPRHVHRAHRIQPVVEPLPWLGSRNRAAPSPLRRSALAK